MSTGLIIIGILIVVAIWIAGIYNKLVALLNEAKNAFAQIDVQLKRRYDLIPNLIEVVKKYMAHEEGVLLKVVEARNKASKALDNVEKNGTDSKNMQDLSKAESEVSSALKGLNIQVEAYPDLKANQNMMQFSEELTSTENKVGFARQAYNDSATAYNTYKQSFPNNILVGFFPKFQQDLGLLEFEQEIQQSPKVQF
ncbi:MAG: LemA family protein [Campylobacter sp.]|nr:LemA family protein [Campylobacter sp.]